MEKTIIAVYGRGGEGKSDTIKRVCQMIIAQYPDATPDKSFNYTGDVLVTITVKGVKVGIESQGDPNSRMFETVEKLAISGCDIIICATRTEGKTVNKVDEIAKNYGYHTLWISSYWSPTLDYRVLNHNCAKSILEIIDSLIESRLQKRP